MRQSEIQPEPALIRPTAVGAYSLALSLLRRHFVPLLVIQILIEILLVTPFPTVIVAAFWLVAAFGAGPPVLFWALSALWLLLWGLYVFVVVPGLTYGASYSFLRVVRGSPPRLLDVLAAYPAAVLRCAQASLWVRFTVGIGSFLIVPGIIVWLKLSFVPYLVMDERLTPSQAVDKSTRLADGHLRTLVGIHFFGWVSMIVGLLLVLLGFIATLFVFAADSAYAPVWGLLVGLLLLVTGLIPITIVYGLAQASHYASLVVCDS